MNERINNPPVDEFDRCGESTSDEEIQELLSFCDRHYSELADEIRQSMTENKDYRLLYRVLVDDMRRVQAGRASRYTRYRGVPCLLR